MSSNLRGGVGYVVNRFPVLSETFILNEILAMEARGARVHIFSLEHPLDSRFHEDLSRLKAHVQYLPPILDPGALIGRYRGSSKGRRRRYLRPLAKALTAGSAQTFWRCLQGGYVAVQSRRLRLNHLHAHFATKATSVALYASLLTRIPYSFTAHAYDIYRVGEHPKVLARKIKRARFVVTVSDFNKTYLESLASGAGAKIVRIYNGIDLSRFSPNGASSPHPAGAFRQQDTASANGGRAVSPFTLLCVARLVEKKGLPTLLEACRDLRDRGAAFQCWIVGQGPLRAQLQELIEQWELRGHVQLLGPHTQAEVLDRYRSAHLYVLPCVVGEDGNRDGLPVSIVEALACGLPVVATPMTGIPEVVQTQHNGILVPERDARALADALELIIRDAHLYRKLSANARVSVESRFDLRYTAEALHRLFEAGRS